MSEFQENSLEYEIEAPYAMFATPESKVGGEKCSYLIPTYSGITGASKAIYWKPTFLWVIDAVRVMNPIQTQTIGVRLPLYTGGNDLAFYNYLYKPRYQVKAHIEWNPNRPNLGEDRNYAKHLTIIKEMIEKGGRRDVYLGTRECQAYVSPCKFGEGEGFYDNIPEISFGNMVHGITYADEAYSEKTRGHMSVRFWRPTMKNGIIEFPRPDQIPDKDTKVICKMGIKEFGDQRNAAKVEEN